MFHKAKPQLETTDEEALPGSRATRRSATTSLKADWPSTIDLKPAESPVAQAMVDDGTAAPEDSRAGAEARDDSAEEEVQPGFLTILDPDAAKIVPPEGRPPDAARRSRNWLATGESADGARDGEPDLALSFRPRASSAPPATSA